MTDIARPNPEIQTQLRQLITADQADIPVITTAGFVPGARKLVGEEFVLCEAFASDPGRHDLDGEGHIGRREGWVAGGVVVDGDNGGGLLADRVAEDLTLPS